MTRRVVVIELNEVPWRVLDDHVKAHPASPTAQILAGSRQFTSITPDQGHLSPWITWPTVHRGVANDVHGFTDLGQDTADADERFPAYWALARQAGRSVGVFGPLHTHPLPDDVDRYAFWLPDTFAPDDAAHPASLRPFQAFNLAMARASARNVDTSIDVRRALSFLARSPAQGLRPATVATIVRQLLDERRQPWTRVRRRSLQSVLSFDLFVHQLRRHQPSLSVVFTNHVASAMHRYWAARYPDDYEPENYGFDADWQNRYRDEIDVAMRHADRLFARIADFVASDPRCLVVVASSMGQAAAQGTPVRELLLLRDADRFMGVSNVAADQWDRRPAMDPMVSVRVDAAACEGFARFLDTVSIGGEPLAHGADAAGLFSLEFGQADDAIGELRIDGEVVSPSTLGLERVVIEDEAGSSGYHVPEGSLFVYDPQHPTGDFARSMVCTTAIAPAILDALAVDLPHHLESDPSFVLSR